MGAILIPKNSENYLALMKFKDTQRLMAYSLESFQIRDHSNHNQKVTPKLSQKHETFSVGFFHGNNRVSSTFLTQKPSVQKLEKYREKLIVVVTGN